MTNHPLSLIRLANLPLGLTLLSILAGSVINRVMVVELGLPVVLAGLFLAVPLLVSPLRIWLGHLSDAYPIGGRRREPYLVLGALLSGSGVALSVALIVDRPALASPAAALILLGLVLYGIGRNLTGNTFQALLTDRFDAGVPRSRAANLYEVVKILGLVIAAGLLSLALQPYSDQRLVVVVAFAAAASVLLSTLGAVGQEPHTAMLREASEKARATTFWRHLREGVWQDGQARIFFSVILLTVLGTQMQDVLMEPYAGLVLGMDVAATTRLTMFWGLGTLASILLSGLVLIRWLGLARLYRLGIGLLLPLFAVVLLAGVLQRPLLLQLAVIGLGLGSGLAAASLLAQAMALTNARSAGLLLGVWGLGFQLGRALANLLGAGVVDLVNLLTGHDPLLAYGTAFAIECGLLIAALSVFRKLHGFAASCVSPDGSTTRG
jgi:BCD family chlorophyll transporter-like MFS transporter